MNTLFFKSIAAAVLTAALIILSGCGGGSSSSSGTGSSGGSGSLAADATMVVKGNIASIDGAQAMFQLEDGRSNVRYLARLISDSVVAPVMAQTVPLAGVTVCIEEIWCSNPTGVDGAFAIDLSTSGLPAGPYTITFDYNGRMYSSVITVKNYSLTDLSGILLEENGDVKITSIQVTLLNPPPDEGEEGEESTPKISVCHKPGTPAQQNLAIPESALGGHLGHGDFEGACDIVAEDTGPSEEPEEEIQ